MMSVKMDTKLIWDFWYINRYIIVRQFRSLIRVVNPFWTAEANPGTAVMGKITIDGRDKTKIKYLYSRSSDFNNLKQSILL